MNKYLFERTDTNLKTKVRVTAETVESARSQAQSALGDSRALLKLRSVTIIPDKRRVGSPVDPAFHPDTLALTKRMENK
jgi:hypothetical protein